MLSKKILHFLCNKYIDCDIQNKITIYFSLLIGLTGKKKLKVFNTYIIESLLLTNDDKEQMFGFFNILQKLNNAISFVQRKFRWKKNKFFDYNYDLQMNNLDTIKDKNKITILHENRKYIFSLFDLHKIFNKSLLNCNDYICQPIVPKNPYNNKEFTKVNIVNIYFKMMKSDIKIKPHVLDYYYCSLRLKQFSYKNFHLLRTTLIKELLRSDDIDILYTYLRDITFDFYNVFPYRLPVTCTTMFKKKCVKKTIHLLEHYLILLYFPEDSEMYSRHRILLHTKCIQFKIANPLFGRDMVTCVRSLNRTTETIFGENPFVIDESGNFIRRVHESINTIVDDNSIQNTDNSLSPSHSQTSLSTFNSISPSRTIYNYTHFNNFAFNFNAHIAMQDHNYNIPEIISLLPSQLNDITTGDGSNNSISVNVGSTTILDPSNLLLGAGTGISHLIYNNPNDLEISFLSQESTIQSLSDTDSVDTDITDIMPQNN